MKLRRLQVADQKRLPKWTGMLFFCSITTPYIAHMIRIMHSAAVTKRLLHEFQWEIFNLPVYKSGLTLSLSPFFWNDEVARRAEMPNQWYSEDPSEITGGNVLWIEKLVHQYNKYPNLLGNYDEMSPYMYLALSNKII